MLRIDLYRLRREGRTHLETAIPADAAFWEDLDVTPSGPLRVRLEAQQAGADVVVRGELEGEFSLACRRCLEPVTVGVVEEVGLLYREGEEAGEADVLPLPDSDELDLAEPVREQVLLAVPRYAYCRADCEGLCPQCGTNLNEATCGCTVEETDERWAPLRRLKKDA